MISGAPTRTFAAVAIALCVLLGACGDDDDQVATTVQSTSTAETQTPSTTDDAVTTTNSGAATTSADSAGQGSAALLSDYLGSYTLMDSEYGTMVTVTVDGSTRTIESNSLPDHDTGEFPNPGNPNAISGQSLTYEFPVEPTFTGGATFAQTPGVAVNGIAMEPGTAETLTCASGETYRIEAVQDLYDLGLDFNNAHVQPGGQYHYHGVSQLLVEAYSNGRDLVHVGFAADGHLIYYSKSNAYPPSHRLATDPRQGTDCVPSGPNRTTFDVAGTAADGTYVSDWVFTEESGALDRCNGIEIDGQYVYFLTDGYPYIPRCLNGEFTPTGPGGQPG